MQISIASGKGGTGKTTIATSLGLSLVGLANVWFIDCDVEAPNSHFFLKPVLDSPVPAVIQIPHIFPDRCCGCGRCVEVCQYHAMAKVGKNILLFPQLCHGCGSCTWNCPEEAIQEVPNPIGMLEKGLAGQNIRYLRGTLSIGEPMATPVIRQLKKFAQVPDDAVAILDAPPGASCSVVETLRRANYVLLVAEPTAFGLHDLKQMVSIVQQMGIPAGVIINRETESYQPLVDLCEEKKLPILMHIPEDRVIAEGIAAGKTLIEIYPEYQGTFQSVFEQVKRTMVGQL